MEGGRRDARTLRLQAQVQKTTVNGVGLVGKGEEPVRKSEVFCRASVYSNISRCPSVQMVQLLFSKSRIYDALNNLVA